jgi:hypothetical protein
METLRIVMVNGGRRIELEGQQKVVLDHLDTMRSWVDAHGASAKPVVDLGTPEMSAERVTLRTFLAAKQPANVYETIAVVLAYKRSHEGKQELSADDIRVTMMQAAVRPPKAMGQAMADCRRRYGYVEIGSARGTWKLSSQGETLVEIDLPRTRS